MTVEHVKGRNDLRLSELQFSRRVVSVAFTTCLVLRCPSRSCPVAQSCLDTSNMFSCGFCGLCSSGLFFLYARFVNAKYASISITAVLALFYITKLFLHSWKYVRKNMENYY